MSLTRDLGPNPSTVFFPQVRVTRLRLIRIAHIRVHPIVVRDGIRREHVFDEVILALGRQEAMLLNRHSERSEVSPYFPDKLLVEGSLLPSHPTRFAVRIRQRGLQSRHRHLFQEGRRILQTLLR